QETYTLDYIHVTSGSTTVPTATVRLKKGSETLQDSSPGNGAVDAAMQAIDRIVHRSGNLAQYSVEAVTHGRDSLGEVTLKVDFGNGDLITGKGASTDVIEASARAYINAVNRAEMLHGRRQAMAAAPI
ncbi:MAG: alpha-isopropylmalate synthase regulatory domain-containing protein, partial [Terrimicrobiaceae bacterium]